MVWREPRSHLDESYFWITTPLLSAGNLKITYNIPIHLQLHPSRELSAILTFRWPCIAINSCNKTNLMHRFLKFIFYIKLYMFRTIPLSNIRSSSLYTQQWYMSHRFADSLRAASGLSVLILLASCQQTCMTYTIVVFTVKNSYDGQRNCPKHVSFPKQIWEISVSSWFYCRNSVPAPKPPKCIFYSLLGTRITRSLTRNWGHIRGKNMIVSVQYHTDTLHHSGWVQALLRNLNLPKTMAELLGSNSPVEPSWKGCESVILLEEPVELKRAFRCMVICYTASTSVAFLSVPKWKGFFKTPISKIY